MLVAVTTSKPVEAVDADVTEEAVAVVVRIMHQEAVEPEVVTFVITITIAGHTDLLVTIALVVVILQLAIRKMLLSRTG